MKFLDEKVVAIPRIRISEDTIFTILQRLAAKVIALMTILFIFWC